MYKKTIIIDLLNCVSKKKYDRLLSTVLSNVLIVNKIPC